MLMDALKILIGLIGYGLAAPVLGAMSRQVPWGRVAILATMVVMTGLPLGYISVNAMSIAWYKGDVKGFELSAIHILGLSLFYAQLFSGGFRSLIPSSAIFWALYCMSLVPSFLNAHNLTYATMALWKYTAALMVLLGSYHAIRSMEDILVMVRAMAVTLMMELLVALRDRYVWGMWRIRAWFEHSNCLGFWSYQLALPVLSASMQRGLTQKTTLLCYMGVVAALALSIMTVSRGALAIILVGSAAVVAGNILLRPSIKKMLIAVVLSLCGMLMLAVAWDTLSSRFGARMNDNKNETLREVMIVQCKMMAADYRLGVGLNNFAIMNSRPHGAKYSAVVEEWDRRRGMRNDKSAYLSQNVAENLYMLHLAETGILGLGSFILFQLWTIYLAFRNAWYHRGTLPGAFSLGLLILFGLMYPHGWLERVILQSASLSAWMIAVGALCRIDFWRKNGVKGGPSRLNPPPMQPLTTPSGR